MLSFPKFLYSWLLPRGLFVFAFFIAFVLFYKTKGIIWFVFSSLLMYLLSVSAVTDYLFRPLETQYPQLTETELKRAQAQAIVVLGGGVKLGAPDINSKGQISNCSANRY